MYNTVYQQKTGWNIGIVVLVMCNVELAYKVGLNQHKLQPQTFTGKPHNHNIDVKNITLQIKNKKQHVFSLL